MVFEEGSSGEGHLLKFFLGDDVERGATVGVFAVFDFCEVDFVAFGRDDVDFVELGFVVTSDDAVAVGF